MKLVIIFGPQAVGKMTVGHELEKITGLKLFHNHMTIDLVLRFFEYGTPSAKRLIRLFREEMFKEVAASDLEGLIFTFGWAFNFKEDSEFIERTKKIFTNKGADIYFVELEADVEERIRRNTSEHRLQHKPSKQDTASSGKRFTESLTKHRMNSEQGEITEKNYIRIDNTNVSAAEAAQRIKERFNL